MALAPTEFVHEGAYVDYGRNATTRNQWLFTSYAPKVWLSFLAILLTVAIARLFKAILRVDALAAEHAELPEARTEENGVMLASISDISPIPWMSKTMNCVLADNAQGGQLLFALPEEARHEKSLEGKGWHTFLEALRKSKPGDIQLPTDTSPSDADTREIEGKRWKLFWLFLVSISYFGFYIGVLICGISTAGLGTDSTALSASPKCGVHRPPLGDPALSLNLSTPYEFRTELDSALWAERCYHAEEGADGCNSFLQQSIPYTTKHNATCPFADYMCHGGKESAISFSTGAISARALGINMPKTYEFERTTTCSPLNMNDTYIRLHQNGSEYTFTYHYGRAEGTSGDWSWITRSYGTDLGKTPAYNVGVLTSIGGWTPLPELQPINGSTTNLIFVLPQKIYYLAPSEDPIFPANKLAYLDDKERPYWLYTRGHATVLGCVDQTRWRDPDQGETWNSLQDTPPDVTDRRLLGGLWLFWFSIQNSSIYQALNKRLANALDATERIVSFTSLPLAPEQWKVEAIRLFETSLARNQIDARNIARGVLADAPGYIRVSTPPEMCQDTYLFISQGWTNVSKTLYLIILVPSVVILVLAIPISRDRMLPEWFLGHWAMFLAAVAVYVAIIVGSGLKKAWNKVFNWETWSNYWETLKKCVNGSIRIIGGALKGWKTGWKIPDRIRKLWKKITCRSTE